MRLFQRPGGSVWWVDFHVGSRRFRETSRTTDKIAARTFLARRMTEEQSRAATVPKDLPTLDACLSVWGKTLPPGSRRSHDDMKRAGNFVAWFGPQRSTGEVQTVDVTRWIRHLQDSGRLAPATVKRHKTSLSAMFKWAREISLAPTNPVEGATSPRVPRERKQGCLLITVRKGTTFTT